jgi:hypothetical protein
MEPRPVLIVSRRLDVRELDVLLIHKVMAATWANAQQGRRGYEEAVRVLRHWQACARGESVKEKEAEHSAVQALVDRARSSPVLMLVHSRKHRGVFGRKGSPQALGIDCMVKAFEAGAIERVIQCQLPECGRWAVKRADAQYCTDYHRVLAHRRQEAQEARDYKAGRGMA